MSNKCEFCKKQESTISVSSKDNDCIQLCDDCFILFIHKDKLEELRK